MPKSIFFRLLDSPIDSKGTDLFQQIVLQNQGEQPDNTFLAKSVDFGSIPSSPFSYWTSSRIFELFSELKPAEGTNALFRAGLGTTNNTRFVRLFWEVASEKVGVDWVGYCKGGPYSPYYYDIFLVVDWKENGKRIKQLCIDNGDSPSRYVRSESMYFKPGLTWPLRTQKGLNVRTMPKGCIFGHKGPAVLELTDNGNDLLFALAVMNSSPYKALVDLQMAFGSFEVGVLQNTPFPLDINGSKADLIKLVSKAYQLTREGFISDETNHVFSLPLLGYNGCYSLYNGQQVAKNQSSNRETQLEAIKVTIDKQIAELYKINAVLGQNSSETKSVLENRNTNSGLDASSEDEDEEEDIAFSFLSSSLVSDLLMWWIGVAFGRWDTRFAINPNLLPTLAGPFDPLPRCSPGMLVSPDGLPATQGNIVSEAWLRARPDVLTLPETVDGPKTIPDQDYPLPIAWDGILVDDPDHPRDIVSAVRRVLRLIWKEQADAIEKEACQILEVPDLRAYFRDPRLFFNYHIKRYSKSRRKAPIYWLLQSAKRNYAVWIYYPRLNPDLLFRAGREYVDAKLTLETSRLQELRSNLSSLTGTNLKTRERQVSRQVDLIEELKAFGKELDRVALLELKPDLNDGVLLNIAPLYNLVPWKEAEKIWKELAGGKYEWSSIGQQLRQKGWVKK